MFATSLILRLFAYVVSIVGECSNLVQHCAACLELFGVVICVFADNTKEMLQVADRPSHLKRLDNTKACFMSALLSVSRGYQLRHSC